MGGEAVARAQPVLLQGIETVEAIAQKVQLVDPAALDQGVRYARELFARGLQHAACTGAQRFEGFGGICVASLLAQAIGVVVMGPAVKVGVLVGVGVPGVEDLLAVSDVVVEAAQEVAVCVMVGGDESEVLSVQGWAADWVVWALTGVVAGFVCCRRAERTRARSDSIRAVCASATCCGLSELGSCTAL